MWCKHYLLMPTLSTHQKLYVLWSVELIKRQCALIVIPVPSQLHIIRVHYGPWWKHLSPWSKAWQLQCNLGSSGMNGTIIFACKRDRFRVSSMVEKICGAILATSSPPRFETMGAPRPPRMLQKRPGEEANNSSVHPTLFSVANWSDFVWLFRFLWCKSDVRQIFHQLR